MEAINQRTNEMRSQIAPMKQKMSNHGMNCGNFETNQQSTSNNLLVCENDPNSKKQRLNPTPEEVIRMPNKGNEELAMKTINNKGKMMKNQRDI